MFLLSKGMELLENYLKLMLYNILFSNLVLALIPVCNSNKSINAKKIIIKERFLLCI